MNPTAPIDNILYVNDLDGQIGEVNLSNGAVTDIVETGLDDLSDIAITSSGVLYGRLLPLSQVELPIVRIGGAVIFAA
jgi:hypothetical protein